MIKNPDNSCADICRKIGRGKNSVVVEIRRNGGREIYNANKAHEEAAERRKLGYEKISTINKSNPKKYSNPWMSLNNKIESLGMQIQIVLDELKKKRDK